MPALANILKTGAKVLGTGTPGAIYNGITKGNFADTTPGYSATNVYRTQIAKAKSGATAAPQGSTPAQPQTYTGPYGGGSNYGAGAAQAQQQALADRLRGDVVARIHSIQGAYDSLNQAVDDVVKDKAGQLYQNYGNQTSQLNNTYSDTSNQLYGNYQNRGIGDSSYSANAQDSAGRTYKTNLDSINQAQAGDLANLGQYASTAHQGFNSGKNSLNDYLNNVGSYGSDDLSTIMSNLAGVQQQVAGQQAGLGTQGSFINQVNAIAPKQNGGAGQLQSQLQSVLSSAAPSFAKQAIGQGLITQATTGDPQQQSYWNQYFNQLQSTANTGK